MTPAMLALGTPTEQASAATGDVDAALRLARSLEHLVERVGDGSAARVWSELATLAALDVTTARVVEPHLDARSILAQAGEQAPPGSTWGVFAAEGRGVTLTAHREAGEWMLTGTKPWCSLADRLTHALVTAHTPTGRALFAVDLRHPGITTHTEAWVASGFREIASSPVDFVAVPAKAVGEPGWYLERPGFSWGGIRVAACWWGGAVGVAQALLAGGREPDQLGLAHLGAVDQALTSAQHALGAAADALDAGELVGAHGSDVALRTRVIVARAAELVLTRTAHALGPAPLAFDAAHARRVADLSLFLRQHHDERDEAALGARRWERRSW